MSVLFDLQALQNRGSAERGIGRYVGELAYALERRQPPVVSRFLLNPDLPLPRTIEPLAGAGRLTFSDRHVAAQGAVYHIASPFEPVGIDRIWPYSVRGLRLVVTAHDLIPDIFSDRYLEDPRARRAYRARLELVRRADLVLAVSEATARDVVERLGVGPERVVVTGEGVSDRFHKPASRAEALARVRSVLPWIEPGFLLYTAGGIEYRKNVEGLLEAYAGLPEWLRARRQLIVVCRIEEEELSALERHVRSLGVEGRVFFPGYVTDEELVLLYQATDLFVCPSLYEGFGLPVAEAMACGAAVIAGRNSSLVELVRDEAALFDASKPLAIRGAIERCLADDALLERLREARLDERHTWSGVADRTAAAYGELLERSPRLERRRRRIALVVPPAREGESAAGSFGLLADLASLCDVDLFAGGLQQAEYPAGVSVASAEHFERIERTRGGYDRVVYPLAEGRGADVPDLLRRRTGVVLAPDGRLARETIEQAERVLVPSARTAELARLEAAPGDEGKIEAVPLAPGFENGDRGEAPAAWTPELLHEVVVLGRRWADVVRDRARRRTLELQAVAPLAAHLERPLVVVDVGCRWGVAGVWSSFAPHVSVVGFDPDVAECERLSMLHRGDPTVRFVAVALGRSRRTAPLYVTEDPGSSSLYPPDPESFLHRPELACTRLVREMPIELTTLDDWTREAGVGEIDVIKLDTQGSELGVLEGASRSLESVRALEVEVEFNEMYRGQPLFGDVDRHLRERGFVLWRLKHLVHYGLADAPSELELDEQQVFDSRPVGFSAQGGQLFWGHAYYVRRELAFGEDTTDWRRWLRDGCIVSALGFPDLARSALQRALEHAPAEIGSPIRRTLVG